MLGRGPLDRSIIIGIACTILFHILLILFSPQFDFTKFSGVHSGINVTRSKPGKTFDFELAQPATLLSLLKLTQPLRKIFRIKLTTLATGTNSPLKRSLPKKRILKIARAFKGRIKLKTIPPSFLVI